MYRIGPVLLHAGLCARLDDPQKAQSGLSINVTTKSLQPTHHPFASYPMGSTGQAWEPSLGNGDGKGWDEQISDPPPSPSRPKQLCSKSSGFQSSEAPRVSEASSQLQEGKKCPFQAEEWFATSSWAMCHEGAMLDLQELAPRGDRGMDSLVSPPTPPSRGQKGT